MRKLATYLLCVVIVLAPGCGLLTDKQRPAVLAEIQLQLEEGRLTQAQADFLKEQVESDGDVDWEAIGVTVGGLAVAVVGALTGVRLTRGPAKPMDKSQANVLSELLEDARKRKVKMDVAEAAKPSVLDANAGA